MDFQRIKRLPKRLKNDLSIVLAVNNWPEVLLSKLKGLDFSEVRFRNGLILKSPREIRLELLFHEIWVEKMYSPKGYEIREGDVVIDIGANIGVYSAFAAIQADNVRVYAFEPFPANNEWLRRNIDDNKLTNVTVSNKAVASDNKTKTLFVSDAWVGHSLTMKESNVGQISIDCIPLQDVVSNVEACNLMKIDCEGSEYDIFYSSSDATLKKIQKIVGEFHEIDDEHMNGRSLCEFLSKKGFTITGFKNFNDRTGSFYAMR